MKKILMTILFVVTMFVFTACGKSKGSDIYGTWEVAYVEAEGVKLSVKEMEALGEDSLSDFKVVFKEGGKVYAYDYGDWEVSDWEKTEDGLLIDGEKCTIKGKYICIETDDGIIYLKKVSDSQEITGDVEEEESEDAETDEASEEEADEETSKEEGTEAVSNAGAEQILGEMETSFSAASEELKKELEAVYGKLGNSYNSYKDNKQALLDWYALAVSKCKELYDNTEAKAKEYYKAVAASEERNDSDKVEEAMDDFYQRIYEDSFESLYDTIYEESLESVSDKYYEGVLEEAEDSVEFGEWLDVRSDFYGEWLDVRSDFYGDWLDARSDLYGDWLDVKGEFYKENFDVDSILK